MPPQKNFKTPFLRIVKNVVHQKLISHNRVPEECKFWILSKSQFQKSRKTSHRWNRFLGPGGKTPSASRELDPRIIWARPLTIYGGKNFDPRKPEVGDFLIWPQFLGLSSSAPHGGRGSGSCRSTDLVEGYAQKKICENLTRGFREKSTFHFSPWAAIVVNK